MYLKIRNILSSTKQFMKIMNKIFVLFLIILTNCTFGLSTREMNERLVIAQGRYSSTDYTIRKAAVLEVSNFTIPEARIFLKKAAEYDSHATVRMAAITSLSRTFPDQSTLVFLLERGREDASNQVKYEVLKSLVEFESTQTYTFFIEELDNSDWLYRELAITGICRIDDPAIKKQSIPYIVTALQDSNENVRIAALENVTVKDEKIYNEIQKIFFTNNYELKITLLTASLQALQGYDLDIRVRERVQQLIVHPNRDIRVLALRVLKSEPAYLNERERGLF
jgi:HEAT repeat protein